MGRKMIDLNLTSEELIRGLRSDDLKVSDEALNWLYQQMFDVVDRYIKSNNGTSEDAEDVFQEGVLSFYKSIRTRELISIENVEAYFFSICRNIWLKQIAKQKLKIILTDEFAINDEVVYLKLQDQDYEPSLLDRIEQTLGEKCRAVLSLFYYEKRSMKEIAQITGLSSEQVAKNKKSLCLKKLKDLIVAKPSFRKVFKRT